MFHGSIGSSIAENSYVHEPAPDSLPRVLNTTIASASCQRVVGRLTKRLDVPTRAAQRCEQLEPQVKMCFVL